MKYIDAERLQANIKEIEKEFKTGNYYLDNSEQAVGYYNALLDFEKLVFSLQQEQPSLPDNLDEIAREIVIKMHPCLKDCTILGDRLTRGQLMALVKAGAEWMARQGYTVDGIVICDKELTRGYKDIVMDIPDELKVDDKVTIQIRKKEEKK